MTSDEAVLGEPSFRIGGLSVWVHGREFPDADDYWDGNWLRATASYRAPESRVRTAGAIIHGSELTRLLAEAEKLYSSLAGTAALPCLEPNLRLELKGNGRGQIEIKVDITPNHLQEVHTYHQEVDQTHLSPFIRGCRAILEQYAVKGAQESTGV